MTQHNDNKINNEPLTAEKVKELWTKTYNTQGKPDWTHIFPYYHDEIVFEDSIQRIEGIDAFKKLCERLTNRCKQLRMEIDAVIQDYPFIYFQWKMVMKFRIWPSTPVYGCTKLTLDDKGKITEQRDYYDIWGDIINGIPGFKKLYRWFMKRYFG
jgi:hypothetical protein